MVKFTYINPKVYIVTYGHYRILAAEYMDCSVCKGTYITDDER